MYDNPMTDPTYRTHITAPNRSDDQRLPYIMALQKRHCLACVNLSMFRDVDWNFAGLSNRPSCYDPLNPLPEEVKEASPGCLGYYGLYNYRDDACSPIEGISVAEFHLMMMVYIKLGVSFGEYLAAKFSNLYERQENPYEIIKDICAVIKEEPLRGRFWNGHEFAYACWGDEFAESPLERIPYWNFYSGNIGPGTFHHMFETFVRDGTPFGKYLLDLNPHDYAAAVYQDSPTAFLILFLHGLL